MRHTFGVVISIMCVDVLAIGNCPMQFGNMVHSLFSDQEGQSISNNVFSELASLLQFVTLQLLVLCFYWNVQCIRACQLLLNCFPFFFPNRDWAGLDWIWSSLLIPWDHYAIWQGIPGNGECKNNSSYWWILPSFSLPFTEKYCCLPCWQILFVSGVLLTIGLKPTVQFFTKPKNHKVLIVILSPLKASRFSSISILISLAYLY
jgi:hypothetical protein